MDLPALSLFSLAYACVLLAALFRELGRSFPYRELIMAIMGVQLVISPFLEYYSFRNEVFGVMRVEDSVYFGYVLPCMLLFHLGLHLLYPRQTHEIDLFRILRAYGRHNHRTGWVLIGIGFLSWLVIKPFPDIIPPSLSFLFVALAFLRFIGFFYLWIADAPNKWVAFGLVFIPFTLGVVQSTIFIDLIVLSIFFLSLYLMQHKVSRLALLSVLLVAGYGLFLLQSVKYSYRRMVWDEGFEGNATVLLYDLIKDRFTSLNREELFETAKHVNIRVNQGWILTDVLANRPVLPAEYEGRYFYRELVGLVLPRFIYPEKPVVGDRDKFRNFTGWGLGRNTAMNVGIMGDGYGNFGYRGGILFCFGFGLFLGALFRLFYLYARRYPTLPIWGILIFFYSMRAGNEFYIIANWIIKTGVLVLAYYLLAERWNTLRLYRSRQMQLARA